LKKVLILSYFFPPCNLTASQRAFGWAKFLNEFGYYPVVVTRKWENEINSSVDVFKSTSDGVEVEKHEGYEVHYLPYTATFRDRILQDSKATFSQVLIRKLLTFIELISQNYTNYVVPFRNIKEYSDDLISREKSFHSIIVTANPFVMFKFGHELSKKYRLPWVADYRDDWSTSEINKSRFVFDKIVSWVESKSEKKWLRNVSFFTTISHHYRNKISLYTGKRGEVILNGFFEEDYQDVTRQNDLDEFSVVYNGTLYGSQKIELFIAAFKMFVDNNKELKIPIKLKFIGLAFDPIQTMRVKKLIIGYEKNVEITSRISREEVIAIQKEANLLLMLSHESVKGIPSSKLYEYLGLRKPILVCPTDDDILKETVGGYNLGDVVNSEKEILKVLNNYLLLFKKNESDSLIANDEYVLKFTRKAQTDELSKLLDQL
jgi:glycosyltransferase involved in cell wall biosynthesis